MFKHQKTLVISIEGGEGSGKTTLINQISHALSEGNTPFMVTREPGGVIISERIREIILDLEHQEMDPRTEALLFAAARRQHLVQKVIPAMEAGKMIIFDRFIDSSLVYQGYVRGIGIDEVKKMNEFATEGFLPDLTLYLDIDPQEGLNRIHVDETREKNKLDLESLAFHEKVREGYLKLAEMNGDRIKIINAAQSPHQVFEKAMQWIRTDLRKE